VKLGQLAAVMHHRLCCYPERRSMAAAVWLCCRFHAELANLQPLRAAAAESAALRERLREASAAAAALAASRQELKAALDDAHAGLAAATERCRQLEGLDQSRQLLCSPVRWFAAVSICHTSHCIVRPDQTKPCPYFVPSSSGHWVASYARIAHV